MAVTECLIILFFKSIFFCSSVCLFFSEFRLLFCSESVYSFPSLLITLLASDFLVSSEPVRIRF